MIIVCRVITEADEVLGGQQYVTAENLDSLIYLEQVLANTVYCTVPGKTIMGS